MLLDVKSCLGDVWWCLRSKSPTLQLFTALVLCLFVNSSVFLLLLPQSDFSWIVLRLISLLFVISLPSSSHPYCSLSKPFSSVYSWLCCIGASASCGRKVHTLLSSLFVCLLYISSRIYDLCMAKTHPSSLHLLRQKSLFWCLATRGELVTLSSSTRDHLQRTDHINVCLFQSLMFMWGFWILFCGLLVIIISSFLCFIPTLLSFFAYFHEKNSSHWNDSSALIYSYMWRMKMCLCKWWKMKVFKSRLLFSNHH